MRRIAQLLTVCLLLMAIPLKGAVAAGMLMCGPGQERTTTTIAAGSGDRADGDVGHHHREHALNDHISHNHAAHDQASNAVSEPAGSTAPSENEAFDKHGAVKCSICAACCVAGAFLISANALMPASAGSEAPFPALIVQFPGFVLAGLERPPRTFLV